MPIIVKDFIWEQTEKILFITLPLKGVVKHKVDILTTESYIKVNFKPYVFECFLYADVHDLKSAAEIGNGTAIFKLEKLKEEIWPTLQSAEAGDKIALQRMRTAALERYAKRIEDLKNEKATIKHENGRFAVRQQMEMEDADRRRIDDIKVRERIKATEELEAWKEHQRQQANQEKEMLELVRRTQLHEEKSKLDETKSTSNTGTVHQNGRRRTNIFQEEAGEAPLRESGKISITFTPRVFPTPTRESLAADENTWLAKQAEARRLIELEDKDLSEEERNPVWLRDKGNSFFQAGNYQAAINAYTHAIRLDCKMPAVFSNRAACHLKMNNLFRCIEDCSKALDLLTPPLPQNAASRAKVHVRRGTAYSKLQLYAEGLMDYEAALKLDPDNESLQQDALKIRSIIQGSTTPPSVDIPLS